jgi:hypothetical protein
MAIKETCIKQTKWKQWLKLASFQIGALLGASNFECFAQQPIDAAVPQLSSQFQNVARLNLGISFYDSGWYNCNSFYPPYACNSGSFGSYMPFTLGLQTDIHLGNSNYFSPGIQVMTGTIDANYFNGVQQVSNSAHVTLWEIVLDYVRIFGPSSKEVVGRLRTGTALYFASGGGFGGGFRTGIGGSFFNNNRVGIGLDLVFELGSYNGYRVTGLQLLVSPEFHF